MIRKMKIMPVMACVLAGALAFTGCGSSGRAAGQGSVVEIEKTTTASETSGDVTIDEQVLIDHDGMKVTATGYETDSVWGDGVKLLIENNTQKNLTFGCNALIVNDFMITDLFAETVAAGKKSNTTLHLSNSGLKAAGIENVGKIEVDFRIHDSDNYDDVVKSEMVTIKTSAFDQMDTSVDDSGTELYNAGGIRVVGKTVDEDSFWGTAILLYCENNSGKNVGITVDDMSINGFMINPIFSSTVYNGKRAFDDISILSSDLEKNGITELDTVELKFHIYDSDSYATIANSETVTFSAKK